MDYAGLSARRSSEAAERPSLTLGEVDRQFDEIATAAGPGFVRARAERLGRLFARATVREQDLLFRLVIGGLRQDPLAGIMAEAVARAASTPSMLCIAQPRTPAIRVPDGCRPQRLRDMCVRLRLI